jgi:hypothetical protein
MATPDDIFKNELHPEPFQPVFETEPPGAGSSEEAVYPAGPAEQGAAVPSFDWGGEESAPAASEGEMHPAGPAEKAPAGAGPSAFAPTTPGGLHVRGPHEPGTKKPTPSPKEPKKKPFPVKMAAIAVVALLVIGGGVVAGVAFFGSDDTPTPQPSPSPVAENTQNNPGQSNTQNVVTENAPSQNSESADTSEGAQDSEFESLLAKVEQPAANEAIDAAAITKLEETIRTNPAITEDQLKQAKAWADSVRASATDPKTVELIFLIDLLTEDTAIDFAPPATNGARSDAPLPAASHAERWVNAIRSPELLLAGWLQPGAQSEPAVSEETLLRWLNDENATVLVRARAALRLAAIYRESDPRQALTYCLRGLQLVDDRLRASSLAAAEASLLRRQDLQLRQMWSELNSTIAAQIASAEQRISEAAASATQAAQQAGDATSKADQTAAAARNAALVAVTSYVQQCRQRLQEIKASSSDQSITDNVARGEEIANKLIEDLKTAADLSALSVDLERLSQGVLALESRVGSAEATPVVTSRAELERFAAAIDLPEIAELIGPGESQDSLNPRYKQALDKATEDLAWVNEQLAMLAPDKQLTPEQAQDAQIRIREILYNALLLEARKQVAQIAPSSGVGPLPEWIVSEQEMTAALTKVRGEFSSLRDAVQSIGDLSAAVTRANAESAQLARRIDQVQSQAQAQQSRSQAVADELRGKIAALENAPAQLSPEQMQNVVQQVLSELVIKPGSGDVANSPEVNTALAAGYYLAGLDAYQSGLQQEALRQFTRAVYHDPNNPIYRYYLGLTLRRLGRYNEALAQAQAGRKLEVTHRRYNVHNALARVQGEERMWLERL